MHDPGGRVGFLLQARGFAERDAPAVQPGRPDAAHELIRRQVRLVVHGGLERHKDVAARAKPAQQLGHRVGVQPVDVRQQNLRNFAAEGVERQRLGKRHHAVLMRQIRRHGLIGAGLVAGQQRALVDGGKRVIGRFDRERRDPVPVFVEKRLEA